MSRCAISFLIEDDLERITSTGAPPEALSDLIRFELLHRYGGIWADATTSSHIAPLLGIDPPAGILTLGCLFSSLMCFPHHRLKRAILAEVRLSVTRYVRRGQVRRDLPLQWRENSHRCEILTLDALGAIDYAHAITKIV